MWVGIRPARRVEMISVPGVAAHADRGLEGDRYSNKGGSRQVTLIQHEHLLIVAAFLGLPELDPSLVRRNLVISGINVLALKGMSFKIGEVVFQYSGECHPCSRMEENLGVGGYNAMRGHGGITARVIESGTIKVGDFVCPIF